LAHAATWTLRPCHVTALPRAPARGEGSAGIEAGALLLEPHDAQIVRPLDLTRVGRHDTREHLEQGRLAAAVGTDQADARARRHDEVEIADEPGGLRVTR